MTPTDQDIEYSHSILSYVIAGIQGEFASLNILGRLHLTPHNGLSSEELNQAITILQEQLSQTLKGTPTFLLSWKEPESAVAQQVFKIGEGLSQRLQLLSEDLRSFFITGPFNELPRNKIGLLLATLGQHIYSRDSYFRCFYNLFKERGENDEAMRFRIGFKSSEKDIEHLNGLLTLFHRQPNLPLEFFHVLYGEVVALPGLLKTQSFDLRVLLAVYDGPLNFRLANIPDMRAQEWENIGISPLEAGHWEAHEISPSEALSWMQSGITDSSTAGLWKAWNFPPKEAGRWFLAEFGPNDAATWANEGFDETEARQLINRGVSHPSLIKR